MINKLTLEYLHGSSSGQVGYTRVTLTDGREQAFLYGRNQGPVAAAENAASQESPVGGGSPKFFMGDTQASLSVCDSLNLTSDFNEWGRPGVPCWGHIPDSGRHQKHG